MALSRPLLQGMAMSTRTGWAECERPQGRLWTVLWGPLTVHTYKLSCLSESKEEGTPLKLKCELCGRVDFAYKFKRSKRFCSMACAKR